MAAPPSQIVARQLPLSQPVISPVPLQTRQQHDFQSSWYSILVVGLLALILLAVCAMNPGIALLLRHQQPPGNVALPLPPNRLQNGNQHLNGDGQPPGLQAQPSRPENDVVTQHAHQPAIHDVRLVPLAPLLNGPPLPAIVLEVKGSMEVFLARQPAAQLSTRPASDLLERLNSWCELLKNEAMLETRDYTEDIRDTMWFAAKVMIVVYIVALWHWMGEDAPVMPLDPIEFLRGATTMNVPTSSWFSWLTTGTSYLSLVFMPFGRNLMSLIPYAMVVSWASAVLSPLPFIGPAITKIVYLILALRLLQGLIVSAVSMVILEVFVILPLAYSTSKCLRMHRFYSGLLFSVIATGLGLLVALFDPHLQFCFNPVVTLMQCLGFGDWIV